MQNDKSNSPNSSNVESLLEMIISEISMESPIPDDVDKIITNAHLRHIFKQTNQDFDIIFPKLMGVSTVLCLLTYRLFSIISDALPPLSSNINLNRLLTLVDVEEIGLTPPHWDQMSSITMTVGTLLGESKIKDVRQRIENLNLDALFIGDIFGTAIQNYLPTHLRKALAANYTSLNSSKLLSLIALDSKVKTIIDPFCGSGRLLTTYASECKDKGIHIHGNEILGVAALLTFVRLLYWFVSRNLKPSLAITGDDAFIRFSSLSKLNDSNHQFQSYDLVIMNPPFTRYLRIQRAYLDKLSDIFASYEEYMQAQMGLHVFAIFLADMILEKNGRIAAVLPAPTFYSQYSKGLMGFLAKNYQMHYIVSTTKGKAFSEGSDFREILFVADKKEPTKFTETHFITIDEQLDQENILKIAESIRLDTHYESSIRVRKIAQRELEENWNWIRYLESSILQEFAERFRETHRIKSSKELELRIVRGFEMYGPDFFFLPNKYWMVRQDENEKIIIENETSDRISIDKSLLSKALRRPGLYSTRITPFVDHFVLNVHDAKPSKTLDTYIHANPKTWQVAKKRFGSKWITHIHRQLQSKKPFGHLFVVDKFGITSTGVIAHYTDERISASKNFYVVDCSRKTAKILAAWLNSTLFIVLYLASRREIGGAYGRLQIVDYEREPLFIDINQIDGRNARRIEGVFDKLRNESLPPLKDQIRMKKRRDLDTIFLQVLGYSDDEVNEILTSIYDEVSLIFDNLDIRSKHKQTRM